MTHDRVPGNRFTVTHNVLSQMLGVRRSGVTLAAGVLHSHELISYVRGHIVVNNRKGLERAACGCYRVARDMDRVSGGNRQTEAIDDDDLMTALARRSPSRTQDANFDPVCS
jgi:hypothetical protein